MLAEIFLLSWVRLWTVEKLKHNFYSFLCSIRRRLVLVIENLNFYINNHKLFITGIIEVEKI